MTEAQQFVSKPITIEAMQLPADDYNVAAKDIEEGLRKVAAWIVNNDGVVGEFGSKGFTISTLEGEMLASLGDWVIKGTEGEFYPCKDSVFKRKYDCQPERNNGYPN